ncbi:MAG: MFS transporter permease [Candidatus Bathyarchaeota archaeon B63]|nr:MAG: MFS transporter permease [Candidatus Bathyarchaeota archaeon B63]
MLSFLIFGFGAGVSYAASIAYILRWKRTSRGYSAGVFESLIGVGYLIGPLLGGFLSEFAGNAPYIYVFLMSLTVLVILLRCKKPLR